MFNLTIVITNQTLRHLLAKVFPQRQIAAVEPLPGGLINTNLRIDFQSNYDPVVLRLYRDGADVCRKEIAVDNLIQSEVPVPKILYAEPNPVDDIPSFAILEFIDGLTFQQLKRTSDVEAIRQASRSVGETLAAIGRFRFPKSGRLVVEGASEQLSVGASFIEGPDPIPRLLDTFLESQDCQNRAGANLVERIHNFTWTWADQIPNLDAPPSLVHCDFGNRNILVREENGKWIVAAVLDWEFALSGSPLLDVGHFLRYETDDRPLREPHFSKAFVEHGGYLPEGWREIVRVIDLTALVECLTHDYLPAEVESELIELIVTTLES
ncbi:MAG TPA: phosphotransferase [Pyrinomonadaceae bacterium]|jgi:Putative homoserine kinase type II (protein kinase fold)|nr:phosphotransferase [Pyrinomonadaceae bacterium]